MIVMILSAMLLVLLVLFGYSALIEPFWLKVRHYDLTALSEDSDCLAGKRVVFFSDFHFGKFTPLFYLERVCKCIKKAAPDLILFGGDLVDEDFCFKNEQKQQRFSKALQSLKAPLGKFAVFGNHDLDFPEHTKAARCILSEGGFVLLENSWARDLPLYGFADALRGEPFYRKKSEETTPGLRLFMIHESDFSYFCERGAWPHFDDRQDKNIVRNVLKSLLKKTDKKKRPHPSHAKPLVADACSQADFNNGKTLYLSGHAHGGQFLILGLSLAAPPLGKRYTSGLYKVAPQKWQLVSKGVGTVHIHVRCLARPDICVLQL